LGYLFDRSSGRIRQTEAAFDQSVEPEVMQDVAGMLGDHALLTSIKDCSNVYQRRANNYSFNTGGLKGVIERNERDRIYRCLGCRLTLGVRGREGSVEECPGRKESAKAPLIHDL